MCTGESPRSFPSYPHDNDTCAVTPQQHKVKTSVVFPKSPSEPCCGQWNSFSFVHRGPPKNDNTKVTLGLARKTEDLVWEHVEENSPLQPVFLFRDVCPLFLPCLWHSADLQTTLRGDIFALDKGMSSARLLFSRTVQIVCPPGSWTSGLTSSFRSPHVIP